MNNLWQLIARNTGPLQAVCAVVTVIVAVVAAIIALRQLSAGYRIHREQAQPYVAVGMRSLDQVNSHFIEFFLHNFGQTAAFDIHIISDPPIQAAWQGEPAEPMWIFNVLPTLVPGDEWTQMMGFAPAHFESDLPMKYNVKVEWKDSSGKTFTAKYLLDWEAHRNRINMSQKTVHHLSMAAEDIDKSLEGIHAAVVKISNR
ncbi:MAG: hypothetical protein ACRCWS_06990 [Propionibacteriaceae bacterium]